jgi:hypothetical protein
MAFDTQAALADDPTQSALREITLSLDVPHVDRGERAVCPHARGSHCAGAGHGWVVTDDNGVPCLPMPWT